MLDCCADCVCFRCGLVVSKAADEWTVADAGLEGMAKSKNLGLRFALPEPLDVVDVGSCKPPALAGVMPELVCEVLCCWLLLLFLLVSTLNGENGTLPAVVLFSDVNRCGEVLGEKPVSLNMEGVNGIDECGKLPFGDDAGMDAVDRLLTRLPGFSFSVLLVSR